MREVTIICDWCHAPLLRRMDRLRRDMRTVCEVCRSLVTIGPDRLHSLEAEAPDPKRAPPFNDR